ncbi:aminoglycoside phosphotransferase family protein [Desulfosoma sp.]|uniref:aminoglycoside phosphotransferase family protein n=1 Tax=Desulfosoma sp. TaxID=2603217 RepID=UPI00404B2A22
MAAVKRRLRRWGYSLYDTSLRPLAGDGSDRLFFRLQQPHGRYVVLVSPRSKEPVDENDAVWHIGRHLHRIGVPVPGMLHADVQQGVFVFQDLGSVHLYDLVHKGLCQDRLRTLYHEAVGVLARCHRRAWKGFCAAWCHDASRYDPDFVYERELLYFRRAFLEGLMGVKVPPSEVCEDFRRLALEAGEDRSGLVFHRDFQSRNLMVFQGSLWVIDFQGMRFGPPEYDVAALLLDPYVMLPLGLREELVQLYWRHMKDFLGGSYHRFRERLATVALCRCLQFLAAFAYLGMVKHKRNFLRHIPAGWQRLQELLSANIGKAYPGLRRYLQTLPVLEQLRQRVRVIQDAQG